jgi:hypothetical protein
MEIEQTTPKRGRGRPRKYATEAESQAAFAAQRRASKERASKERLRLAGVADFRNTMFLVKNGVPLEIAKTATKSQRTAWCEILNRL